MDEAVGGEGGQHGGYSPDRRLLLCAQRSDCGEGLFDSPEGYGRIGHPLRTCGPKSQHGEDGGSDICAGPHPDPPHQGGVPSAHVRLPPGGEEEVPDRVPRVPGGDGSWIAKEPLGDTARGLQVLRGARRGLSGVQKQDNLDGLFLPGRG